MPRVLLLVSLLVIAAGLALRWWFHGRLGGVLAAAGKTVRTEALDQWKLDDPKGCASRIAALRFGMAVPPLSILVAVFAVLVGKIPILTAIVIVAFATALATASGILTLPAELAAIQRHAASRRMDDDLLAAAVAAAWNESIPTGLRALVR